MSYDNSEDVESLILSPRRNSDDDSDEWEEEESDEDADLFEDVLNDDDDDDEDEEEEEEELDEDEDDDLDEEDDEDEEAEDEDEDNDGACEHGCYPLRLDIPPPRDRDPQDGISPDNLVEELVQAAVFDQVEQAEGHNHGENSVHSSHESLLTANAPRTGNT